MSDQRIEAWTSVFPGLFCPEPRDLRLFMVDIIEESKILTFFKIVKRWKTASLITQSVVIVFIENFFVLALIRLFEKVQKIWRLA